MVSAVNSRVPRDPEAIKEGQFWEAVESFLNKRVRICEWPNAALRQDNPPHYIFDLRAKKVVVITYFDGNDPLSKRVDALVRRFVEQNREKITANFQAELMGSFEAKYKIKAQELSQELSQQDVATLGFTPKELETLKQACPRLQNAQLMLCFHYALLRVREPAVQELFFLKDDRWRKVNTPLLEALTRWGYAAVDQPEPEDLVLYLNHVEPLHMGVYLGNGLVESKLGPGSKKIHQHPLHLVLGTYGDWMQYYRKVKSGTYRALCPIIQDLPGGVRTITVKYQEKTTSLTRVNLHG